MVCKNCGFETPSNSNFCAHCGARIDFDNQFVNPSSINDEKEGKKEQKENQKFYNRYREVNVDNGHANPAWYYLGFFCPIAGFVLYYIYCYKKPNLAYKCRRGAVAGIIFDICLTLINLLLRM